MAKAKIETPSRLCSTEPPHVHCVVPDRESLEATLQAAGIARYHEVDLADCGNLETAFDAIMIGLQLPYTKLNYDAFLDVMMGPNPIVPTKTWLIVISNAHHFLKRSSAGFSELTSVLNLVGSKWAKAVTDGEHGDSFDRAPVAFHVLLPVEEGVSLPIPKITFSH